MDIGSGVDIEKVDKFCYLGDMLAAEGGADAAVVTRVRSGWFKFKQLAPFLLAKGTLLTLKGRVYDSCVRSCMLYGSETRPIKVENEMTLDKNEMKMIRLMCGVRLFDKKTNV